MKRAGLIYITLSILALGLVVGMSIQVPSGTWGQGDNLLEGRSGAASALLPGGSVLAEGPLRREAHLPEQVQRSPLGRLASLRPSPRDDGPGL